MQLPPQQIFKKATIGVLDSQPVYLVETVGGLNVVVSDTPTGIKVLGVGSHPGLAKYIASRKFNILFSELRKSEEFWPQYLVDKYIAITEKCQTKFK